MNRQTRVSFFLILLLLFSAFASVVHFHADAGDHHDCPICVAGNHQSATKPSISAFDGIPCFTEITVVAPSPVFTDNLSSYSLKNRAPHG